MIVFIGILLIVWPIIAFAAFVGMAINKKWWSYDRLSRICGFWGSLMGIYYFLILGGLNTPKDTWPVWVGYVLLFGLGTWYGMHNSISLMEQRQLEKEQKEQKKKMSK